VVAALLFLAGPSLLRFYTDWLWFGEVGYRQVFTTIIQSEATLFTIAFVVSVIWLIFNLRLALGTVGEGRPIFTTQQGMEVALPGRQQLRTIASAIAMFLSALIGLFASSQWETWVTWRNAVPFGQVDPILGRDVSFYVFTIPFIQFVRGLAQTLVVLAALGAGALYLVSGSLTSGLPSILSMTPAVRRHLALLGAVFFVLLATGAWLGRYELLITAHPAGVIYGAAYADVYGRLPMALVLTGVSTAQVYSRHLKKTIAYGGNDLDAWEKQVLPLLPSWMVFDFKMMYAHFQRHGLLASADEVKTLETLLGHPPRTFDAFVGEMFAPGPDGSG
jgi:hypothetical protein